MRRILNTFLRHALRRNIISPLAVGAGKNILKQQTAKLQRRRPQLFLGYQPNHRRSYSEKSKENPDLAHILQQVEQSINEEMVKETKAIFQFIIKDHGTFFIDLKNGKGSVGHGEPPTKADAILTMDIKNFLDLFAGKLKPKLAVMLGKLKVGGSTAQALKLEKLLPHFRGETS